MLAGHTKKKEEVPRMIEEEGAGEREERDRGERWGGGGALKFTAGGQRASRGNCPKNNTRKLAKNTLKISF
jgi:hypothetical protein